jgi:hypothetical protein
MPTVSELSKLWRVSHQYISKLVKRGLPLSGSVEDANVWREVNASSKASTSPRQIAKRLAEEKSDASPTARPRCKRHLKENLNGNNSRSDDRLSDALDSTIQAQGEAWRLLQEAMVEGRDSKITVRLSIHNKAVEARFKAEQSHREELERRRILIPLAEAKDISRKGYDIILSRLAALPQNLAVRCNPTNPHLAMEVLEVECNATLAEAQRAYADNAA